MFSLLNLIGYTTIMSITPGPNNVICLTQGTKYGYKSAYPYTFGVAIGLLTQLWLLLLFSSFFGNHLPIITKVVSYFGAGYMIYLALKMFTSSKSIQSSKNTDQPMGIMTATLLQYANPKAYIFNTTIITGFILPFNYSLSQTLMITVLLGLIFILCTNAWVLFGQVFNQLFSKYRKLVSFTLSASLIYLAISIVLH